MLNIMLVDDEVLAMEYLKNITNWEAHGYHIAGCAASGKKALRLYEEILPEIVISDIRMPVMDGLELTRQLKEKNGDVEVVLLSAYGDFEYAKRGIQYGVFDYLLKHELNEAFLLEKLDRVRERIVKRNRREKIYQKYFMEQLIYHPVGTDDIKESLFGNRLFLLLIHKRNAVCHGEIIEEAWNTKEKERITEVMEDKLEDKIFYVTDVQLAQNNWLVLYRIKNTASKYTINTLIELKAAQVGRKLMEFSNCHFNILYSLEITQEEISITFRNMSRQIRHSVFFQENRWYVLNEFPCEEKENLWGGGQIQRLKEEVYKIEGNPILIVRRFFEDLNENKNLSAYKSLTNILNHLLREIWEKENIEGIGGEEKRYTIREIAEYYEENFGRLHDLICEETSYSGLIQEVIRYIRKNYEKEVSLDTLGEAFQMNGVYLGQIFRKEVGTTFLKYLTEVRIEEAKRFMKEENLSVSEVAERVGYRTSQYFSKVFGKVTGMTPWEFRRWKEKD